MQKASITTAKNVAYCIAIILILCGCATRQDIHKDLTATREAAFKDWQHQKKATGDQTTTIQGSLSLEKAIRLSLTYNRELQATPGDGGRKKCRKGSYPRGIRGSIAQCDTERKLYS
ncbi:MAG: hypothetical protein JRC86_02730 [Deltaproteobacteria bacterium]|nr:hypothetical protein [Deltaproteobacteria bacterium]